MKKNFKLLAFTAVVLFAVSACKKEKMDPIQDSLELKRANNGMIKSYDNTMVLKWNEELSKAIDNKMPPPPESRIYAMVSIAVHDALNNVVPKYETYALDNSWNDGKEVSKKTIYLVADAAVAQAAHDVLVALFPPSIPSTDALLADCLSGIEDSELKDAGIQIGKDAAKAMLEKRQGDAPSTFVVYPQGVAPGEYRSYLPWSGPGPIWQPNSVYAPNWGETKPFGVMSGNEFRAAPPYALNSPEYAADYNEVKTIGSESSVVRTPEQTEMGIFFTDNMPSMLNKATRYVAASTELNGWETARLIALVQMSEADALICTFESSFLYNFWRPITAIHEGNSDGNDNTEGEPGWLALTAGRAIPPLPPYPSSYASAGKAGAEILKMFFGTDNIPFVVESYTMPGVERSYSSFSQVATDMQLSRIYVGHNFRNDNVAGDKIGKQVAEYVFKNNLRAYEIDVK